MANLDEAIAKQQRLYNHETSRQADTYLSENDKNEDNNITNMYGKTKNFIDSFYDRDKQGQVQKWYKDILGLEASSSKEIAEARKRYREEEAKEVCDIKAKELLCLAMAKYSQEVVTERTVSVVAIPNDEMKGRIIGREGRNIRTIEQLTGVDLIIDDTPEAIVLSSFDPLRREIARITIDTLIKDGRIHPARIEEIYDKTAKEMKTKMLEYGEAALFELGITKVDSELIELIGRLNFRKSYGKII